MKRSMTMSMFLALTMCMAPELINLWGMVYVALLWDELFFGKGN